MKKIADELATALRAIVHTTGGNPPDWLEAELMAGDKALAQYDAAQAVPMPEVLIETTDVYGRAFKDAVESFILAGADPVMVQTVLDAFGNNAPDADVPPPLAEKLADALRKTRSSLENWVELQDESEARDYDDEALAAADEALAAFDAAYPPAEDDEPEGMRP